MKLTVATGAACLTVLAGCSSIVEGTSQEILINTNPSGASCNLLREGVSIARVSLTPGAATINKTKHDITIECELANFHKATYFNKSDAAGATFGNIILGGGIGWAIDSASGADNKYTSPVNLSLVPITEPLAPSQPSVAAPAAPAPQARATQDTSIAVAAAPSATERQVGVDGEYRATVPANLFNGNPAFEMRIAAHGGQISGYGIVPRTAPMHCHAKGSMRLDGDAFFHIDCATGGIGAVQTFRVTGRFAPEADGGIIGRTTYQLSGGMTGQMIWQRL